MDRTIDALLNDYGQWVDKIQSGGIGFPSRSHICAIGEARAQPHGHTPGYILPERLRSIDRAIKVLPENHLLIVKYRYLYGLGSQEQEQSWIRTTGKSRRQYYDAISRCHEWIAGYLSNGP